MDVLANEDNGARGLILSIDRQATAIAGLAKAIVLIGTNDDVPSGVASAVAELGYAVEASAAKLLDDIELLDDREIVATPGSHVAGADVIELV